MLLCYITDRTQFTGSPSQQRRHLVSTTLAAARTGVDLIQLREKDLGARELEMLAGELLHALKDFPHTRLLINSRTDVAIAAGAHGVHLPADDITASEARAIFTKAGATQPTIGASCHTAGEVAKAEAHGADFAVFGPVFEKEGRKISAAGLAGLREVCNRPGAAAARMPVLALGGVTLDNASACLACGADGIAAIRLFQSSDVARTVKELRGPELSTASAGTEAKAYRHPYWQEEERKRPKNMPARSE
jgi:thiamine-phosphate pyrophosphorylase